MKIELLALADFAADYGGKLSVIGIFDTIFARQMPAVHPHCCLAVKLRFDKDEEGPKRLRLAICDDDGKLVLPAMEIPIQVAMPPDAPTNTIQVVANIGGMKIESFGEYSIDLELDGRHEGSSPLYARQMK
ncbi:DUF6941 family protein [Horticoccus sp. 23ND18S-11]|uniref:DUF6941 family protein n=1 Tax=Horticoccus sp. 23ND18S-11 TaxID=3391832 RepID=UPI0039C93F9D